MHRKIIRKVNDNDDGRDVGCVVLGVRGSSGVNAGRSVVRAVLRNAPDIQARNNAGAR